jgi:hypothetical protein
MNDKGEMPLDVLLNHNFGGEVPNFEAIDILLTEMKKRFSY